LRWADYGINPETQRKDAHPVIHDHDPPGILERKGAPEKEKHGNTAQVKNKRGRNRPQKGKPAPWKSRHTGRTGRVHICWHSNHSVQVRRLWGKIIRGQHETNMKYTAHLF
jgi:hypothetical protein